MSIINEALKKAAEERVHKVDVPSTRLQDDIDHLTLGRKPVWRRRFFIGSVGGSLLISVVVLVVFFGREVMNRELPFQRGSAGIAPLVEEEFIVEDIRDIKAVEVKGAAYEPIVENAEIPADEPVIDEPIEDIIIQPPEDVELPKEKFVKLPELSLYGVMQGRGGSLAIIDDTVLGIGDNIKGAIVVEINKESVNLLYEGQEFVLRIK